MKHATSTMTRERPFRLGGGVWFAAAVLALLVIWYGGNELYTKYVILPRKYPRLNPGAINLIGIRVGGYRIKVSNGIATMEEASGTSFGRPDDSSSAGSGAMIPMKGLIGALMLEPKPTSELIASLGGLKYEIEPLDELVWPAEKIKAALQGDAVMKAKLEYDLSTRLDGKALARVNWKRLSSGIWIRLRVPVKVPSPQGAQTVIGEIRVPYKTRLASRVSSDIQTLLRRGRRLEPDRATIESTYAKAASRMNEKSKEDVAGSLAALISDQSIASYARPAENLLGNVVILVTEKQITGATLAATPKAQADGDIYSITLDLTTDSRDRLWQYTYAKPGAQLLLVSNAIAIAAPFVQHEIKYSRVTITAISDEDLANEALSFIKRSTQNQPQ
ncbi:MAG: hypothetical protein ACR2HJ_04625 [Fimbriimonadales bacterium]